MALGRSLQDAERQTRILTRHLAALENGDFHLLPSGIYARGFVFNYANWLQLNPQEMVRLFNEARGEPELAYKPQPVARSVNTSGPFSPNFVVIIFVIGILSVVAAWGYSLLVQEAPKKQIIDPTIVAATPTAIPSVAGVGTVSVGPSASAGTIRIPTVATGSTSSTSSAASSSPATTPTNAASTAAATPPATSLKITITTSEKSWVEAYVDGDKTAKFIGFLNPGESQPIEAKQTVLIVVGKPDRVTYTVNGKDKGSFPKEALKGFTIKLD